MAWGGGAAGLGGARCGARCGPERLAGLPACAGGSLRPRVARRIRRLPGAHLLLPGLSQLRHRLLRQVVPGKQAQQVLWGA